MNSRDNFKAKIESPVLIVGLGVSGNAILRLLKWWGVTSEQIHTFDDQNAAAEFRDPQAALAKGIKTLIVSPGVPLSTPWIQKAKKSGLTVTSELDLAFQALETEKVIAITGSVGKSTVTALLGAGMRKFDPHSFAGGNIGVPLADYIYRVQSGTQPRARWIALELSSYQLENFASLRADACIVTALTPNHLERYDSQDAYYRQKLELLSHTQGPCVMNRSGLDLLQYVETTLPIDQRRQIVWTDRKDPKLSSEIFQRSKLLGTHNQDNLALCLRLGELLQWPNSFVDGLVGFPGLPHRLENFGEINGVLFINDSKATTMSSVLQAVDSLQDLFSRREKTYLLIGGKDKNLPWQELQPLGKYKRIHFVFFGEVAEKAKRVSGLSGTICARLSLALQTLFPQLENGDAVLLSPGGTSLDEFKSFEDRGNYFRAEIERWSSAPHRQG